MTTFKANPGYMSIASGSLVKFSAKGVYSTGDKAIIESLEKNPNVKLDEEGSEDSELESLRMQYFEVFGEKPHGAKKASTLREELEASEVK